MFQQETRGGAQFYFIKHFYVTSSSKQEGRRREPQVGTLPLFIAATANRSSSTGTARIEEAHRVDCAPLWPGGHIEYRQNKTEWIHTSGHDSHSPDTTPPGGANPHLYRLRLRLLANWHLKALTSALAVSLCFAVNRVKCWSVSLHSSDAAAPCFFKQSNTNRTRASLWFGSVSVWRARGNSVWPPCCVSLWRSVARL